MSPPDYIEPTMAMRVKLLAFGALAVAISVTYDVWAQPLVSWIATLPTCESLPWVRAELIVAVAVCWLAGFAAMRQAITTLRSGQVPTPGAWVWVRTRIRTGFYARATAAMLSFVSAAFIIGPLVVIWSQNLYLIFCSSESCGC